jgi:hypothetical protein
MSDYLERLAEASARPRRIRRRPFDWQLDEDLAALAEAGEDMVRRVQAWVLALKEAELHVGVAIGAGPLVCVTCGAAWPCQLSPHK